MKKLLLSFGRVFRPNAIKVITIGLVLVLPSLASAAVVSVPATFTDIQNAINAASPGDTIQVAAGTLTLGQNDVITIPCDKLGIKLVGAGVGSTVIEKSAGGTSYPALTIGTATYCSTSTGATVVEGFTFKNTGTAARAISIRSSGNSATDPAIIKNTEFLGFTDTGISIVDYPLSYWEISQNKFDGSRLAIWINQADYVTIHANNFKNFVVAVGQDPGDLSTNIRITDNAMDAGAYSPTPANYYDIYMSGAAYDWLISGNVITKATFGIRILPATSGPINSLNNVVVQDNCIYDNTGLGDPTKPGHSSTTYGVYNTAGVNLDAKNNWWGDASGPYHPTLNPDGTGNSVSDNVAFAPWLTHPASACAPANEPPVADANGPYLVAVGQTITLDGSGSSDPDGDPLTYLWAQAETLGTFNDAALQNPEFMGTQVGITDLTLTVSDGELEDSDTTMLVVYDPAGGFVTGGGWIWSAAGYCQLDEACAAAEGKATFGFVSKYKKGATVPEGNTEFQFKAGDLNFHSSSYDWLVVNQGATNAQFKGMGTINGEGSYKFMLWAGDHDPDTFRIKIWEEVDGVETVVYDNGFDQAIGGGSIVVHKAK